MEKYKSAFEWVPLPGSSGYPPINIFSPPEEIRIERNTLTEGLASPIGTKPLREMIREKDLKRVLILVDDQTRPTPQRAILPEVLKVFESEGITPDKITILIAVGLHRPMTKEEIDERFGIETVSKYRVLNHDAFDKENLVNVGQSSDGTDILVNKAIPESDFIMTIGQISPHRVVGFSGGAKMIQPGVCGEEITASVHWRGWLAESDTILAIRDNPIRNEIVEIGTRVGLDFIINVLMGDDEVIRYYCGDHYAAFSAACEDIVSNYTVEIPESDIVIADGAPYDFDIWQAAKAVSVAELVVKKGGVVILLASCPDGWSAHRAAIFERGYLPAGEIIELVESEKLNKFIGCHFMAFGRVLDGGRIIVVSKHLNRKDVERVNLSYSETLEEALATGVKG